MNNLQRILFLLINSFFIAKYTNRVGLNPIVSVILYCIIASFIGLTVFKSTYLDKKKSKTIYFCVSLLVIAGISFLHHYINPLNLQVDRWSAIHNFLYNLLNGIYPYSAHTHLGGYGSPFPIWQVFHLPFYLLGNVGFGMTFSFMLLSFFLIWLYNSYQKALIFMIFLIISPAFWYEVAVRSDLIYNFILCFICIAFIHKKKYSIQKHAIGLGILCGLFLSTRFSIVIPFAVYLFPDFMKSQIKHKIVFISTIIVIFSLTFLPFVLWSFDTLFFFKYNPFVLQTRQGSVLEVVIIAALGLYFSTKWENNFTRYSTFAAFTLFCLVTITFLHRMISDNFTAGLFDSAYDITYFNMALPFIIFSLTTTEFQTQEG